MEVSRRQLMTGLAAVGITAPLAASAGPAAGAIFAPAPRAQVGAGATQIVLKIGSGADEVPGDSTLPGFAGQIDILAWQWSSVKPAPEVGAGRAVSAATSPGFSFTKYVDKSTTALLSGMVTGRVFPTAVLSLVSPRLRQPLLSVEMRQVQVTSHSSGGSNAEDRFTESLGLVCEALSFDYSTLTDSGRLAQSKAAWNYRINTATLETTS